MSRNSRYESSIIQGWNAGEITAFKLGGSRFERKKVIYPSLSD
jgi:hypothetical protein